MDIEAPHYAVALWLEGDFWMVRLPDHQLLSIPAGAAQSLQNVLVARTRMKKVDKIGTPSLPTQEIIDSWKNNGFRKETWEEMVEKAGARARAQEEKRKGREVERKRKERERRKREADAEELLVELGL